MLLTCASLRKKPVEKIVPFEQTSHWSENRFSLQWDENAALFFLAGAMERKSKCAYSIRRIIHSKKNGGLHGDILFEKLPADNL